MKASKRLYYNDYFLENINNSKKIWNGIKEIVRFTPKINQKIVKIMQNGNELTDPKQVANAFNKYFANMGVNLARSIPKVNKLPLEYLKNPVSNTFYLFPITPSEVEIQISNLKPGKSAGPYSLPVNILKIIRNVISVPLASLFNTSISSGVVPEKFKVANVVPVCKKDSQTNVSNYRPISLLSVFNKILEKLISNRLLKFLEKENIFFKGQFGFRPKHSTDYAILSIIDKVQKAVDEGELSGGLFLDFSKASDTVDHDILIDKLEYYGIRGIGKDWFTSYLKNRKQMVTVNGATSDLATVPCGIPQGSVLGPILFLLYINDFHKCSSLLDFHLFADDANLFYRHRDIAILRQHINTELKNVNRWLCSNKLSLNIEKSSYVIFHPCQKKISSDFNLVIDDVCLKKERSIKYLGVYIDSNLSWKPHIEYISKKLKRSLGILSKIRYYIDINILTGLYYALIYPFLTYAIIAWGNTYSTTLKPLYVLQKKALRLMTFSKFDEHSSPLFKTLNIIKLHDLVSYQIAIFMYKFKNRLLPLVFNNFFTEVSKVHQYNTRSAAKHSYYLPKVRTNYGKFNIRFQAPKIWNAINEQVKTGSLSKFKLSLKEQYLSLY